MLSGNRESRTAIVAARTPEIRMLSGNGVRYGREKPMTRRRNTTSPNVARMRLKLGPEKRLKDPYNGASGMGRANSQLELMSTRHQ